MGRIWWLGLALWGLTACDWIERWQGPPIKSGSVLTYAVTETGPELDKSYAVRFAFAETADDQMALQIRSANGERTFKLARSLQVRPQDPLELALASGQKVHPGLVWLPPELRQAGKDSSAGPIGQLHSYKEWKVLSAEQNDEQETAVLYFELETGLLVGFHFTLSEIEVQGTLVAMR